MITGGIRKEQTLSDGLFPIPNVEESFIVIF